MSFIGNQFIDQRSTIFTESGTYIKIDATTNEQHEHKSIVTDNPVEDGSNVADHVSLLPNIINISAVFSDTPVSKNIPLSTFAEISEGRARELYNELFKIWQNRETFKLVTGLKAYNNVVFEELSAPRQSGDGEKITVQAKIKQIVQVDMNGLGVTLSTTEDVEHSVAGLISLGILSI